MVMASWVPRRGLADAGTHTSPVGCPQAGALCLCPVNPGVRLPLPTVLGQGPGVSFDKESQKRPEHQPK